MNKNLKDYQVGVVKWFGGYNSQRERENDFGFIESMGGEDVFVHKNEIKSGGGIDQNDIVIYEMGEGNGKVYARNVYLPELDEEILEILIEIYKENKNEYPKFFKNSDFYYTIEKILDEEYFKITKEKTYKELIEYEQEYLYGRGGEIFDRIDKYLTKKGEIGPDLYQLLLNKLEQIGGINILRSNNFQTYITDKTIRSYIITSKTETIENSANDEIGKLIENEIISVEDVQANPQIIDYVYDNKEKHEGIFSQLQEQFAKNNQVIENLKETKNRTEIFRKIVGQTTLKTLLERDISLDLIPEEYVNEREEELLEFIRGMKENQEFFENNIKSIPKNIVIVSIIEGLIKNQELIYTRYEEIKTIVENKMRNVEKEIPHYLNISLNTIFGDLNAIKSVEIIQTIIEPMLFKRALYNKNPNTKQIYDQSKKLTKSIEYFVLANIFPLILANNSTDVTFKIFLNNLWIALKTKIIDISDAELFKLFPSCSTMGNNKSCEAFYWPKQDIYLCRGYKCHTPQVIPNTEKDYLDFNIYDWFQHYGIDYKNENKPSKKDFPIKLAGYLNRLKEIFDIIKCRECTALMLPDMRYARVDYKEIDPKTKKYKTINTSAAYRVTVFECNDSECKEYRKKYYINHCLGFGCYEIIDSRDLKQKCDSDLYICRNCGSCCEQCAKKYPNGYCPDCGNQLILYEKDGDRFVYCRNRECEYKITTKNLTKKFHLQSAPVKIITSSANKTNNYQQYSRTNNEDLEELPY